MVRKSKLSVEKHPITPIYIRLNNITEIITVLFYFIVQKLLKTCRRKTLSFSPKGQKTLVEKKT